MQIGVTIDAHYVRINKFSLFDLALLAYQVKPHQLTGPNWMANERYDIQAKLQKAHPRGQVPAMLQKLLADRFGMSIHRENRDLRVSALVVAKGGHHLEEHQPAEERALRRREADSFAAVLASAPAESSRPSGPGGNSQVTPGPGGNLHMGDQENDHAGARQPAQSLLRAAGDRYDRPRRRVRGGVGCFGRGGSQCRTGAGRCDSNAGGRGLAARKRPPSRRAPRSGRPSRNSDLKLDVRKAPFEVIVIDKAEKIATENQLPAQRYRYCVFWPISRRSQPPAPILPFRTSWRDVAADRDRRAGSVWMRPKEVRAARL